MRYLTAVATFVVPATCSVDARAYAWQDGSAAATVTTPVKTRDTDGRVTVRAVRVHEPPRVDAVLN
ncbi:MAG: hypothetical protein ACREUZ_15310, partial [Burkholderiales bacterium]